MGNLAEMSDSAKVAFLLEALGDAAAMLQRNGLTMAAARYASYVREMRGEPKEVSHE
jgi:hypothetical protein